MKKIEKRYLSNLSLKAAVNKFYNYLEDQFDSYVDVLSESTNDNQYFAEARFNGKDLEIEVWYDGTEWQCKAY
jgi:hypothetical protein